jgi:phospholipase C
VDVPNLSAWRRETGGDLVSAFSFGRKPLDAVPALPDPLTVEPHRILAAECAVTGNGSRFMSVAATTPVPVHVPVPRQAPGNKRTPIQGSET